MMVAHDLRSPLYQLTHLWRRAIQLADHKEYNKLTDTLHQGITMNQHTYQFMDNMLNWTMLQSNQLLFQKEHIHGNALIDQVLHDFRMKITNKEIRIHKNIPKDIYIHGDLHSYKVIFQNFIDNALKYSFQKGTIRIVASYISTMEYCKFTIRDYGEGMESDTVHKLLHTQERVQEHPEKKNSMGIGFQLCKQLLHKNGASITIESKKHIGTTIILTIPTLKSHNHVKN